MEPLTEAAFARRFRALSSHERRAFLAQVWDARGYHTHIEDGKIIAHSAGPDSAEPGDTPSSGNTARDTLTIAVTGPTGYGCAGADIIVTTRETALVRWVAEKGDADIIPPAKILERLLYAIDRETATAIVAEHLGGPLFGTPADSSGIPISRSTMSTLVVGAITIVAVIGLGSSGLVVPTEDTSSLQGESSLNETTPIPAVETVSPYPDGINGSEVVDPAKAAVAHRRAVSGSPREVRFEYTGGEGDPPFGAVIEYSTTGRYINGSEYLIESAGTETDGERIVRDQFTTDSEAFHRRQANDGIIYSKTQNRIGARWARYERATINLYTAVFSANLTSLQQVEKPGQRVYQLKFEGEPSNPLRETEDFEAVAYVTGDGRVTRLTIQYTHPPSSERVRMVIGTRLLNDSTVEEPDWYDEAVNQTA